MDNKQLEQEAKINLEKFKIIADQSNNGIAITDLKGNIQYINKYFAEIHGYSSSELIGKNLSIFHTEEQMNDVGKINKNLIKTGNYAAKEVWHKHKDGTEFLMLMNAIVIKDDQGKPEYMAATAIDITKQMRIQQRYKFLFESSRDAIMILEPPEWKFTRGNPATIEMFKVKNEEDFCSRGPWQYSPKFQPDNKSSKKKALEMINKAVIKGSHFFEWTHKRLNGEEFPATVLLSRMEIGERMFLQATVRDITKRKKAELQLKQSREQLRELNNILEQKVEERTKKLQESREKLRQQNIQLMELDKKKNDFITMAAHELKTPLVSIYGYVDYFLMAYKDDLNPEMKRDLKIVQRNIKRLRNYMNQLLHVMKIDESKMRLHKTFKNLNELIKKCVKELSYLVEKKNHTIDLKLEDNLILNIDSGRIFQVISNLFSNAIKFSEKGGQIIIVTEKENNRINFKIKDNGIGIKKENLENIFEKFESFDPTMDKYSRERGTGLGLYISKGIIEAHGGEIKVFSEGEGKGTTFTFSLPL